MSKAKSKLSFEEKLEVLEALVQKMEQGGLQLDELVESYSQGVTLSKELQNELSLVQDKIKELKNGVLKEMEEQ